VYLSKDWEELPSTKHCLYIYIYMLWKFFLDVAILAAHLEKLLSFLVEMVLCCQQTADSILLV
jgi:hypothetical protein